jgi:hypothetical protein
MSQLTEVAYYARKVLKYSLIGLLLTIIMVPIVQAFGQYWQESHPDPLPDPDIAFGKIPAINFGSQEYEVGDFSYQLQTADSNLPNLGTQARVYFIPIFGSKFFDEDKTRKTANALGFKNELGKISTTRFAFTNTESGATLKIDTINNNFEISYPYQNNLFFLNSRGPEYADALQTVKSFLNRANLWPDDVNTEDVGYIYLKYDENSGGLVSVASLSESQLTKVNLKRTDIDELPVMAPHPNEANISFIVSSSSNINQKIIFGRFVRYSINYTKYGTYPLKNTSTAWEELKSGKGFVAQAGDNSPQNTIMIRNIYLAYFDPETAQNFLQPIFVFEGYNNFLAYLPAVDSSVLSQED